MLAQGFLLSGIYYQSFCHYSLKLIVRSSPLRSLQYMFIFNLILFLGPCLYHRAFTRGSRNGSWVNTKDAKDTKDAKVIIVYGGRVKRWRDRAVRLVLWSTVQQRRYRLEERSDLQSQQTQTVNGDPQRSSLVVTG